MDKKLIYVINHYSHKSVQHFYHIINLLKIMADKGVKIAIVIEKCDDIPRINHPNIKVICQKKKSRIMRVFELMVIIMKLVNEGYKKIFVRISVNAAIIAIIIARIKGATTYYWHSGTTYEIDKKKPFIKKFKWLIQSYSKFYFIKKWTNYFVSGPETMIEYYTGKLKVNRSKMLLLYNDIDTNRITIPIQEEKLRIRKQLGFNSSSTIILMVHRLSTVRKTEYYIPYIVDTNKLRDIDGFLVIIGDGPEKQSIQKLVSKSHVQDRIIFLGNIPNSDIEHYYKAADIFINPSYTEGFPRVIIEAMASGLPIVATNAGGTIDIMGEMQKNYIIDRDNRDDFKNRLFELLTNRTIQRELSRENLDRVKIYSSDAVSNMYIEGIFNNG